MTKSKKILWMIDRLGPGGAEQLMPAILTKLKNTGMDIRVCVLQVKRGNPIATELERIGFPVDLLLTPNLRNPRYVIRIVEYLRKHQPQIIHTQLEFSDILGSIAGKYLGIPVISTLHTLDSLDKHGLFSWRLQLHWFVLRHITNHILAVSKKTQAHHVTNGRIPRQKITTIYNGLELERFGATPPAKITQLKQSLGLSENCAIITTVAVLREPKGIQFMLQAMPAILQQAPNTQYLIVGDGIHKDKLLELVEKLGLQSNVIFAGLRTDIPDLLACSDLFVLPTLIDALPTVLIEALAAGKPIIASNVGGIPEIVENEVNGLLVPPGEPQQLADACVKLLSHKELGEAFVQAGKKTVQQRFSIDVQIQQLIEKYEELLQDGK